MNILRKILSAVSAAALTLSVLSSVYSPSVSAEDYSAVSESIGTYSSETELADLQASSSKAEFTLMIYMIGSNLESQGGLATEDINEICKGFSGSKVNIIIQTGGAKDWEYKGISSKKSQRFKVTSNGLKLIDDSLGQQNMSNKNTLCSFIKYCKKKYSASRYGLILWNHGGGTIGGFGLDENYNYATMSLTDYKAALDKGGVHFDFVGFDACLMASLETALMTAESADYLIASEDNTSGLGWYYTNWINSLCKKPTLSAASIGKKIADTSIKKSSSDSKFNTDEISVINLKKVTASVIPALNSFSKSSVTLLTSKKYHIVAMNRAGLSISDSYTELVDISEYASCYSKNSTVSKSAAALKAAVKKAVVYRKSAGSSNSRCGLSIAFPFNDLENLDLVNEIYDKSGYETTYTDFLEYFANIMAGGQQYYLGTDQVYNYSACDWYDEEKFYADSYYAKYYLDDGELELKNVNGQWVLPITEDNSALISDYELCMFFYDEETGGIMDFGTDNISSFDDYGNLIVEYDETWVSLGYGVPIPCYYMDTIINGDYIMHVSYTYGAYNGYYAKIYLVWDNDQFTYPDNGIVIGWSPLDEDGHSSRIISAEIGDRFNVLYDVYDENFNYLNSFLNDELTYTVGSTSVTYEDVSYMGTTVIYYKITDIFNNVHFTETVYYES